MHRGDRAAFDRAPRRAALTALLLSAFAGAAACPVALGVEVAITGTPPSVLAALCAGSAATVTTVHFDRRAGDDPWRAARGAIDARRNRPPERGLVRSRRPDLDSHDVT